MKKKIFFILNSKCEKQRNYIVSCYKEINKPKIRVAGSLFFSGPK